MEKVELPLKDWDFLDNIRACNTVNVLEERKQKKSSHLCDMIEIRSVKGKS